MSTIRALPDFLAPITARLEAGRHGGGLNLGAEKYLRKPTAQPIRGSAPRPREGSGGQSASAVLLLIFGSHVEEASLVIEERAHTMRSQPGQFALPGGRVDPSDRGPIHTAVREAHEEIGIDASKIRVLGSFHPVWLPARHTPVTPVLAWDPRTFSDAEPSLVISRHEVHQVIAPALVGPGSLCDPRIVGRAAVGEQPAGIAFDVPHAARDSDAFVWGFTASLIAGLLEHLEMGFYVPNDRPAMQVPPSRLRSERKSV